MILNEIDNVMLGSDQVDKIYLGDEVVWLNDYSSKPLTFKILTGGTINWFDNSTTTTNPKTIKYSKNGGEWTSITSTPSGTSINVSSGDIVEFLGDNASYAAAANLQYSSFSGSTAYFNVYGNIMSLIDSVNFPETTAFTTTRVFNKFFQYTNVVNASNLVLPVLTLTDNAYVSMFQGCTSLTKAPKLPATTLSFDAYNGMFSGCVSLTKAPELPATTLVNYCYSNMFNGCTSLTTAPELPATTLVNNCYYDMFNGCTSLNYIKCLATDISASTSHYNWVRAVSPTGTFVKAAGMNDWSTGNSGIPDGWTVIDNA